MDHELDNIERARELAENDPDDQSWRDEPEPEPDEERPLVDTFDIAAINAARAVLVELAARCTKHPERELEGSFWLTRSAAHSAGHLAGLAEGAENELFELLNYAKHHLGAAVSDAQMFNRKESEGA